MANTVFVVENGLKVVGVANLSGNVAIGGDLQIGGSLIYNQTASGDFAPAANNAYLLGNTTSRWSALYSNNIEVTTGITALSNATLGNTVSRFLVYATEGNFTNAVAMSNTLSTVGNVTFSNTLSTIGNVTFSNTLSIVGATTFSNTINVSGAANLQSIANIAGNLAVNSSVLFVDATTIQRVGIKTNNPDATLHVVGTANVSGNVAIGGDLAVNGLFSLGVGSSINTSAIFVKLSSNTSNQVLITTNNYTINGNFTTNTTIRTLDAFNASQFAAAKYIIRAYNGSNTAQTTVVEMLATHDGNITRTTEFAQVNTVPVFMTYDTTISGGNFVLQANSNIQNTFVSLYRTLIA